MTKVLRFHLTLFYWMLKENHGPAPHDEFGEREDLQHLGGAFFGDPGGVVAGH
jgi:hypothetical protein